MNKALKNTLIVGATLGVVYVLYKLLRPTTSGRVRLVKQENGTTRVIFPKGFVVQDGTLQLLALEGTTPDSPRIYVLVSAYFQDKKRSANDGGIRTFNYEDIVLPPATESKLVQKRDELTRSGDNGDKITIKTSFKLNKQVGTNTFPTDQV